MENNFRSLVSHHRKKAVLFFDKKINWFYCNFMEIENASSFYVTLQPYKLSQLWYLTVVETAKLKGGFGLDVFLHFILERSKLRCNCHLRELEPWWQCWKAFSKVPLTSSRSLTASVFPHRAASCRAVPALVCLLMSIPAWISSLTAGAEHRRRATWARGGRWKS